MSLYETLAIIIATVSTGVAVGIATWTMLNSLRKEVREEIKEVREEIKEVREETKEVREETKELREGQQALDERMARVEGLIEGLREAVTRWSAA